MEKLTTRQRLVIDLEQAEKKLRQFPDSARIPRVIATIKERLDIIDGKYKQHKTPAKYVLEKSTYWKQRQQITALSNEIEALRATLEALQGWELAKKYEELYAAHQILTKELAEIEAFLASAEEET